MTKTIHDEIADLERRLPVLELEVQAAEIRRDSALIEAAWAKRSRARARLKALKAAAARQARPMTERELEGHVRSRGGHVRHDGQGRLILTRMMTHAPAKRPGQ